MSKVKVQFLASTVADKKQVKKGDIMELSEKEAHLLISLKKAVKYPIEPEVVPEEPKIEPKVNVEKVEPSVKLESFSPSVEKSEPKEVKKSKKGKHGEVAP
jgi:hypothetical protein